MSEQAPIEVRHLRARISSVLNSFSAENGSNTPDFILAEYLTDCLTAFDKASLRREAWYGKSLSINQPSPGNSPRATLDPTAPKEQ